MRAVLHMVTSTRTEYNCARLILTCSSWASDDRPLVAASGNRDIGTTVSSFSKCVCCNMKSCYFMLN